MKIGELASRAGANVETIRYYERIGLLPQPPRTGGNYRDYGPDHVDRLAFVRHARGLGFELEDIRALLRLADEPEQNCAEADRITSGHLDAVERKIAQLQSLRTELQRMIRQCRGGQIADCKIIGALSEHGACGRHHQPEKPRPRRSRQS
jgi:Cu(I)-responsive transcriptional regulator